ncbi:hypothetical protein YC2023_004675 [Brassica napus]
MATIGLIFVDWENWRWSGTEGTKVSEDLDWKKLVVKEKMVVATMAITRSRFKLSRLEQRRFGEFRKVTQESELQNPALVRIETEVKSSELLKLEKRSGIVVESLRRTEFRRD